MIIVAVAALIGGRLYHVIDQWQLYRTHPITAILPLDGPARRLVRLRRVHRPRRPRRDHHRDDRRLALRPARPPGVLALGRRRRARACSSCRRSGAGATSSTRSSTGRRRRCRGASGSTAPTGSRDYLVLDATRSRRPTSSRCSCTSRCRGSLGALVLIWLGRGAGLAARAGRPAPDLLRLVRPDAVRARGAAHAATGRSSASRRPRS